MLRPIPQKYGYGFVSETPLSEEEAKGFLYEPAGRHHNYHFTPEAYHWPERYTREGRDFIIDGFSPNLNKELHVGHLRNLALAKSLPSCVRWGCKGNVDSVAFLGASLGVKKAALEGFDWWCDFLSYHPDVYHDVLMPDDLLSEDKFHIADDATEYGGCTMWKNKSGEDVLVKRADGRPLYSYHDLVFAEYVGPTHYITGEEQKDHFQSLDLGDRHLPMGLVLGPDGKKMKSRDGSALPAMDALQMVKDRLSETPHPDKLAWNVLAWNFLHTTRENNLKFEVESWTQPEAPGLYITYTLARVTKALFGESSVPWGEFGWAKHLVESGIRPEPIDLEIIATAEYFHYYLQRAYETLDPAPIANFAHDLARKMGNAYHAEQIKDGREFFRCAMKWAQVRLRHCVRILGMFDLPEV